MRWFHLAVCFASTLCAQEEAPLKTTEDRLAEFGDAVRARLEPQFRAAGIAYPPTQVMLIGLKAERVLEVHARDADKDFRLVCRYPILAASGGPGPKLREGDLQVPEGSYALRELNPNSRFHLSLWIDYPNAEESARAAAEGRDPGGEIMIHGGHESRGCLALGDPAAEDLFVLAALTGIENVRVLLVPRDLRSLGGKLSPAEEILRAELQRFPAAQVSSK